MSILPIALAIVLLGACGKERAAPPPPPPSIGIELVSPGAAPRRALRYHVAEGTKSLLDLELELDVDAGGQGGRMPLLVLRTELAVDDVQPTGEMKLRRTILDIVARDRPGAPIAAERMTQEMQLMRGLSVTGRLDARGQASEMQVDRAGKQLPPAIDAQLEMLLRSFEQVTMALPVEPIGIGASWRYRTPVDQGGVKLQTMTTIVITAIDGDAMTFTSTTQVEGEDQTVTAGSDTMRVTRIAGTGAGGGSVDLTRMTMTGSLTAELESHMSAGAGDENARIHMKMTTRVRPGAEGPLSSEPAAVPGADAAPATGSGAPVSADTDSEADTRAGSELEPTAGSATPAP